MKKCTICGAEKPLEQFSKDKRFLSGRRPECKLCERKRPSYLLKAIRFRLKHQPQWYSGIENRLTAKDIGELPDKCHFCGQDIESGTSIHRINHKGHYELGNVAKVHKTCHAKHAGGFSTSEKAKAARAKRIRY